MKLHLYLEGVVSKDRGRAAVNGFKSERLKNIFGWQHAKVKNFFFKSAPIMVLDKKMVLPPLSELDGRRRERRRGN